MIRKHRKTIRLKNYDYAQPGWYYITVCAQNRECLFGDVVNEKMKLNDIGKMVKTEWLKTKSIRKNVQLDVFQIMPNHIHGIIKIVNDSVGAYGHTPLQRKFKSPSNGLGAIVRGFKSTTTKQINQLCQTPGQKIWQRNYYEHIIRDEKSLEKIRQYINSNPSMWYRDRNNPTN